MKHILTRVLLACATIAWVCPANSQAKLPAKPKKACSLPYTLWDLGKKHDVYFTIEALDPVVVTDSIEWELVLGMSAKNCNYVQEGVSDVNQELQALQRDLPQIGYAAEKNNPKIIHVYDTRLLNQPVYPLNKIVGPFKFKGTEAGLVHSLYKDGISLSFRSDGVDDYRDPNLDALALEAQKAQVDINVQSASVRELLSRSLPLNREDRILWIARAVFPDKPPEKVVIHFGYRWHNKGLIIAR